MSDRRQPRENIIKLGQKITDRIGHKVTVDDPEYFGLDCILTDEMADVANKMKVRKPVTLKELAVITGKEPEHLEKLLFDMAIAGVIEYNWENPNHEKQYILPMFVPGSAEFTNMNQKQLEEHPELARFFERMSRLPLEKVTPMVPPGGAGIGMHVIPVEKAIEAENQTADVEHISHWLKKYEGKYAASPCSCRLSRRMFEEGCADDPEDWCIGVGDMADYLVETRRGHYINYDEVMEILQKAEDNGFVHQITNIDGEDKIFAICNCNVNVCYALRTSQLFNTPNMSRSAYVAEVEPADCVACGRCVEFCPSGAVKLGQKLCTEDGNIEYPKQELPDKVKWGPEKWDEDYRDNNRKNCYDTGTSPCKTACPAHIAIQGYLNMASQGKYTEALALIKKENPFPAVCGRICNRLCEEACTRKTIDEAVAIDEVKKFIAQKDLDSETRYVPKVVQPSNRGPFREKIAIIGGGPAGLSCAFYLAEKGYSPTVFEKNQLPGGMLVYGIPAYKLEKDVVAAEIDVIRQMGVDIKCGIEIGKDVTINELRAQGYKAFYIAIGCQGGQKPGVPGAEAEGAASAVELLHGIGDGTIDKIEGRVVVIGGGNVAMDAARSSMRLGAAKVDAYCLEQPSEMPASLEEITEAKEEGVEINCGYGIKEVLTENGHVKAAVLKKCISVFDDEHRFDPKYDDDDVITVPCDHIFFSIGQKTVWEDMLEGEDVELDRHGRAVADPLTYQTAQQDIFVGGDVITGTKFAIDAIAAGKEGAVSIHRFVQPHSSLTIGRNRRDFIELDKDNIDVKTYDDSSRQIPARDETVDRRTFDSYHLPLTEEQVKTETARCLGCGASVVDQNKCIGCGVCTTKCEFDAIKLFRKHPECSKMVKSEDKLKAIFPYMIKRQAKIAFSKKEK